MSTRRTEKAILDPQDKGLYPLHDPDTSKNLAKNNKTRVTRPKTTDPPATVPPPSIPSTSTAITASSSSGLSRKRSINQNELTPLSQNEDELIGAATTTTERYGDMLAGINDLIAEIRKSGSPAERMQTLLLAKEIHNSETAKIVVQTGRICAENTSKKLQLMMTPQPSQILISDPSCASSATEYKLTFKQRNITGNAEIINPLDEMYNATDHLDIQISDTYQTISGHVICLQNRNMFLAAKAAISNHLVTKDNIPMTDYFEINDQIVSAYAIKTQTFSRSILTQYNLLSVSNSSFSLKVQDTIDFIRKYNRGWFPIPEDVENVEAFGLAKTGDDAQISMKIHISHAAFKRFINSMKTTIMLRQNKLRVYEQMMVTQCLRCCKYGHIAKFCTEANSRCRFCAATEIQDGGHISKNCPNRINPKCCNCIDAYGQNDEDHPINHCATSYGCPLLREEQDRIRRDAKQKAISAYTYN